MDESQLFKYKLRNTIQSILLILALMVMLGILGWLIGGGLFAFGAIMLVVALYFFNPALSPQLILKMYRTRQIMPYEAPNLHAILRVLAQRAELTTIPQLFYLPSDVMNAFAIGMPDNSVIALSDGLLRRLSQREITGVLAHEISHIAHEDIRIMSFADLTSRITNYLSFIGQILLLINLLLLLFSASLISWTAIFILIFAPIITDLLQLALSRNREYDADLSAAELLGDPEPLVSALLKMERYQSSLVEQIFWPGHRSPEPSLLRTHPPTQERVKRLLELKERRLYYPQTWKPISLHKNDIALSLLIGQTSLRPRWYMSGIRF